MKMVYSVKQNGKRLNKNLYTIDKKTKTFSTKESNLVFDFSQNEWTFITGSFCTFKTGSYCNFITRGNCIFNTQSDCTFITGTHCNFDVSECCTFNTGDYCKFNTEGLCVFNTGRYCNFDTEEVCTFKTNTNCIFTTGSCCTFHLWSPCFIKAGEKNSCNFIIGKENYNLKLTPNISTIILDNEEIEFKNKGYAILHSKHKDKFVREICTKILKGEIKL